MTELDRTRLRRNLRSHLAAASARLSHLVPVREGDPPRHVVNAKGEPVCPWPAVDLGALVSLFADALEHFVRALVAPERRQAVMDHPELVTRWDLRHVGPVPPCTVPHGVSLEEVGMLLSCCDRQHFWWPEHVTRDDLQKALRETHDADALCLADDMDSEAWDWLATVHAPDSRILRSLPDPLHGDESPLERARVHWPAYAVSLVLSVERQLQGGGGTPLERAHFAEKFLREVSAETYDGATLRAALVEDFLRQEASQLAEANLPADDGLRDAEAAKLLERELVFYLKRLGAMVPRLHHAEQALSMATIWEERLAHLLDPLGAQGARMAREVRKASAGRRGSESEAWRLFAGVHIFPRGSLFVRVLLGVLWKDAVRPQLQRPVALVRGVALPCFHLFSKKTAKHLSGDAVALDGDAIARLVLERVDAPSVERGLTRFGSMAAFRLLDWLVREGHARYRRDGDRMLYFDGNWEEFALSLLVPRNEGSIVRDLVEALHATEVEITPLGTRTRLISRALTPGHGRKPQRLAITVQPPLLPDYVHELEAHGGTRAREARRLVPWIGLPPVVGAPRLHAAQVALSFRVVLHMRDHARELLAHEYVTITQGDWARMADAVALPHDAATRVLARWLEEGGDGPAFLEAHGHDGFRLGPAHVTAREFLLDGARREHQASLAGRAGSAKRSKRWERKGGHGA